METHEVPYKPKRGPLEGVCFKVQKQGDESTEISIEIVEETIGEDENSATFRITERCIGQEWAKDA